MKKYICTALFFTAFMFPVFGNVSNADALGKYGCGNPDKRTHVNCLRGLLASTPYGLTVQQSSPSRDGLGNYGCGNPNKRTHTRCLRRLLDEHGAHLQVGNRDDGPGTHAPADISHCANMPPETRPQCEAEAHGDPGNHPPTAPGIAPGTHAPGIAAPGTHAPGIAAPGIIAPGTTADGSDSSGSADCSQTPEDGWQSVTEVRSETDYQIGFDDSVAGRQFSKFDNDSSIVCVAGAVKPVYVGATPSDSNLGAYISSGMACNLRNDDLSSGGRGVDKLICP